MGKNLHYSITMFLEKQLQNCDKVLRFEYVLPMENEFIVQITRFKPYDSFRIFVSDAYRYSITDYYNKSREIKSGDFIYLARPEASFTNECDILEMALQDNIYMGQFKGLLSYLHKTSSEANLSLKKYIEYLKEQKKPRG